MDAVPTDLDDFQLTNSELINRFGHATSEREVSQAISARVPDKTRRQSSRAISVFHSWCTAREEDGDLVSMDAANIQQKMCRFVLEVRRQDGAPYPARSLHSIVAGIQRHVRECGQHDIGFLNTADPTFGRLRQTLDARMKELTSAGVEQALWSTGVFDVDNSQGLTNIVFFYNCKLFGLRGVDEHRDLCREQFEIDEDLVGRYLRFKGRSFKNVKGGLHQ